MFTNLFLSIIGVFVFASLAFKLENEIEDNDIMDDRQITRQYVIHYEDMDDDTDGDSDCEYKPQNNTTNV